MRTTNWSTVQKRTGKSEWFLAGQFDENVHRKDFLPSETVVIAKALEPQEKKAAKERQRKHGDTAPGKKANTVGKLPKVLDSRGRAADKLSKYAGVSRRTLEKATEVMEAAEAEPEKYGRLVEEMDRTGSQNRGKEQESIRGQEGV